MKADLERRVHELLDAGRNPADDPEVQRRTVDDPEARAEIAGLSKLDGWLRDWEVGVPEADIEPIAQRIEQRLDERMGTLDVTAAPVFDDPDARVSSLGDRSAGRSGEYSLESLASAVEAPPSVHHTGPSPAVPLGVPRREEPSPAPRAMAPWLAAAAAVGLAITVGVATFQTADEAAPVAQNAPAAEEPWLPPLPESEPTAAAPAEPADDGWGVAEGEATEDEAEEPVPLEEAMAQEGLLDAEDRTTRVRGGSGGAPRMASAMATARSATLADPSETPAQTEAAPQAPGVQVPEADPAFERSRPAVRSCLGGTASAVVMVRFRDGAVRSATVVRPEGSDALDECVASALRRSRLRPRGDEETRTLFYRWAQPAAP